MCHRRSSKRSTIVSNPVWPLRPDPNPAFSGIPRAVQCVMSRLERAADIARAAGKGPPPAGVSPVVRSIGSQRPQKALTTYAHMDRAHCLVRGLFEQREGGERPQMDLYTEYAGVHIHFAVRDALEAYDLRVLVAIVARAGRDGVEADTDVPVARPLRVPPQNTEMESVLGDSVTRSIHVSCRAHDEITIVINPRLAAAVAGGGQYAHLDMTALRGLSDVGTLLYHRLVGFGDRGTSRAVRLSRLVGYAWSEPTQNQNVASKRLSEPGSWRCARQRTAQRQRCDDRAPRQANAALARAGRGLGAQRAPGDLPGSHMAAARRRGTLSVGGFLGWCRRRSFRSAGARVSGAGSRSCRSRELW